MPHNSAIFLTLLVFLFAGFSAGVTHTYPEYDKAGIHGPETPPHKAFLSAALRIEGEHGREWNAPGDQRRGSS